VNVAEAGRYPRVDEAFADALDAAQTAVIGYATTAAPVIAAVAVAFLGLKYIRRFVRKL
jgi:hypothetical protein